MTSRTTQTAVSKPQQLPNEYTFSYQYAGDDRVHLLVTEMNALRHALTEVHDAGRPVVVDIYRDDDKGCLAHMVQIGLGHPANAFVRCKGYAHPPKNEAELVAKLDEALGEPPAPDGPLSFDQYGVPEEVNRQHAPFRPSIAIELASLLVRHGQVTCEPYLWYWETPGDTDT